MKKPKYFSAIEQLRLPLYLSVCILALVPLYQCSDEEEGPDCSLQGTNLSIADMSGNWVATSAIFFTITDPIETVDVVEEGGTVTLSIQSNGGFTLNIAESGGPSDVSSGDFCFDEDLLVVRFDGDAPDDWEYFRVQLSSGNNLSIGGPAEFDFDGNGTPDPAEVELSLIKD
ncbi:hypothetical protein [Muricauda sp. MAR_2010_75]|uniref:hypothetical protein n=1 Tax=Allomuricauda sp. MAR_2010_75 TaxID=1250232 RepID=UPI0012E02E2C|nr:hypothetical protein [Muricauda sp. MAR_2010_75]